MKTFIFVMACMGLIQAAQARESRPEALQACAREAKVKELTGDVYAEFMRGCLRPPEGYKPPVFEAAQARAAGSPSTVQPALTPSAPRPSAQKP